LAYLDVAPGSSDYADALAVDGNRIVVAGQTLLPEAEEGQPFILRLTESGGTDPSFGGGPIIGGQEGRLDDLAVDGQGRYLATGYDDELAAEGDLLIRYLPNGSLDPAFGGSGFVSVPLAARSVATDPAERIVVAGVGGELDFGAARFLGADAPAPGPEPIPAPTPSSPTPPSGESPPPVSAPPPASPTALQAGVCEAEGPRQAALREEAPPTGAAGAVATPSCLIEAWRELGRPA
jgi:uncharacterized delta-60 repeat protein